ncbi:MAG TPA: hypothetical protein VFX22_04225, partial [Candidatus Kapabacteria bacterium]|nr:hypothetical protein [Candidatus Kapabacteria bacterium]
KFGVNSSGGATAGSSVANGSGSTAGTVSKVYIENGTLHDQNFIEVKGIVINGSSLGTLHLRCGRTVVGTGFLRLYSNSYLTAVRVQ